MSKTLGLPSILLLVVLVSVGALPYKDGPPVRHTGGFGEPTCHACHFDGPVDSPEASVGLTDVPQPYRPDSTYLLKIVVSRRRLGAGGFSMSTRFSDGHQAGTLRPTDDRTKVVTDSNGVQFAMHTLRGIEPTGIDSASWELMWTAPLERDSVLFHLAANAANGDDSEFGDLIVTSSGLSVAAAR